MAKQTKATTHELLVFKMITEGIWHLLASAHQRANYRGPGFILKFRANGNWSMKQKRHAKVVDFPPGEFTLTFNPNSLNLSDFELIIDPDPGGNPTGPNVK
jgi:hypothetical protein